MDSHLYQRVSWSRGMEIADIIPFKAKIDGALLV
jgi:hypothetical protein